MTSTILILAITAIALLILLRIWWLLDETYRNILTVLTILRDWGSHR
jgi:hypothetical protein